MLGRMRALVATASKHGSTRAIGETVAARIRDGGHDAVVRDVGEVGSADLLQADAVVLGSATYGARLLSAAATFATRLEEEFDGPVWLFAVGLKNLTKDPVRPATTRPGRDGYRPGRFPVFGGMIDNDTLSVAERALIGALGAKNRDLRDLELVEAWADMVAMQLTTPDRAQGSSSTLPVV